MIVDVQDRCQIVCPRCGGHTIVVYNQTEYVCLSKRCGFRRDITCSDDSLGGALALLAGGLALIALL